MNEVKHITGEEVAINAFITERVRDSVNEEIRKYFYDENHIKDLLDNVRRNVSVTIQNEVSETLKYAIQAEMERLLSDDKTVFRIMEKSK